MVQCRECKPGKGGYNHVDCMDGKKDKAGKIVKCTCWCTMSSKYYNIKKARSRK